MTYLISSLAVVWLCGLVFLAGQYSNDMRLVLNDVVPDARSAEPHPARPRWLRETAVTALDAAFIGPVLALGILLARYFFSLGRLQGCHFTRIDAAGLTEPGRAHLERAIRSRRIIYAWSVFGFILLVCVFEYLTASGTPR